MRQVVVDGEACFTTIDERLQFNRGCFFYLCFLRIVPFGFNNVIVVITDGQSHNPAATLLESNQIHNISGDVISIGIGNG